MLVDVPSERQACYLDVEEVLHMTQSSLNGLSHKEHEERKARSEGNSIGTAEKESLLKKYLEQFTEPLIMLLLGSAVVSIFMGQYDDAASIIVAVLIVSTVAFIQEYKSEKAVEALTQYVSHMCHVIRDNKMSEVNVEDLVEGDLVVLTQGSRVPADLRLIEVVSLRIDESILTGEHKPSRKHTNPITGVDRMNTSLAERKNMAFMGTMVVTGSGKGIVVGTGAHTELGKISEMLQKVENKKTPLQLKMDQLGKHLSIYSFGIIGVIFLIGAMQGHGLLQMFNVGVSLAVAAIPEGLPIVVTVTLALGVTRMSKRNAIVRKLSAVEALGSVGVICVDKTGTLTQNEMTVVKVFTSNVLAVTHYSSNTTEFSDLAGNTVSPQLDRQLAELFRIGILCNNAQFDSNGLIGQPTEGALLAVAFKSGIEDYRKTTPRIEEVPFDSETKWMAVRCQVEGRSVWYVKGAVEAILPRCTTFYNDSCTQLEVLDACNKMSSASLRVVACAYGEDVNNLTFVGLTGLMDPPRREVKDAIQRTRDAGIKVVMITGDSKDTAVAIAKSLGIYDNDSLSMSCQEMELMSDDELAKVLDRVRVFYRMAPGHKMRIVYMYRMKGLSVAMTGDGVNDAPALKMADIGIAMGKGGSDVCRESAEMILVDNNFSTIVAAIEEGKAIYTNIKSFLRFQLSTSVAALTLIAFCTLAGFPLPLNPMQILWINIIMDGPPAQSLTFEGLLPGSMKEPPRDPNTAVIDRPMIGKILAGSTIMVIGTLYGFLVELIGEDADVPHASTVAFSTFVMFQMFNALNCRSSESVFKIGLFTNKFFVVAIGGSIFMQLLVIYLPFLQYVFETTPLDRYDLAQIVAVSSTVFIFDELRKAYAKRAEKERHSL